MRRVVGLAGAAIRRFPRSALGVVFDPKYPDLTKTHDYAFRGLASDLAFEVPRFERVEALCKKIDDAIPLRNNDYLTNHLASDLDGLGSDNQRAAVLLNGVKQALSCEAIDQLVILFDVIEKRNLFDKIIEFDKANKDGPSLFRHAIDRRVGREGFKLISQTPLIELADQPFKVGDSILTPFEYALDQEDPEVALAFARRLVHHVSSVEVAEKCRDIAKARIVDLKYQRQEQEALASMGARGEGEYVDYSREDSSSRMSLDRILTRVARALKIEEKYGARPRVFCPYSDSDWSDSPKTVLQDFGVKVDGMYNAPIMDPAFDLPDQLEILKKKIHDKVKASNGVLIVGNSTNLDARLSMEEGVVDLASLQNRRTYVEMLTIQAACEYGKPMWTICGGTQMAVVALGGKVCDAPKPEMYRGDHGKDLIAVEKGSFLDHSVDRGGYDSDASPEDGVYNLKRTRAFSAHNQVADPLSVPTEFLDVAARSSNDVNVIKAFYGKDGVPLFAMQTHLESMQKDYASRKVVGRIVKAFIDNFEKQQLSVESAADDVSPSSVTMAKMAKKIEETISARFVA